MFYRTLGGKPPIAQSPFGSQLTEAHAKTVLISDAECRIESDAELKRSAYAIDKRLHNRVRRCEYLFNVSRSAVIEAALLLFFRDFKAEAEVGQRLREIGASKRRR